MFRVQQALLLVLSRTGPATTRELARYCAYRLPRVTHSMLQRHLTLMRRVRAVQALPFDRKERLWALPGQGQPADLQVRLDAHRADRRQQQAPILVERRVSPFGSWWVQGTREAFTKALETRWS